MGKLTYFGGPHGVALVIESAEVPEIALQTSNKNYWNLWSFVSFVYYLEGECWEVADFYIKCE